MSECSLAPLPRNLRTHLEPTKKPAVVKPVQRTKFVPTLPCRCHTAFGREDIVVEADLAAGKVVRHKVSGLHTLPVH